MHWSETDTFVIREGGAAPEHVSQYWHLGYPSACQLPDGRIVATYHEYTPVPGARADATPIQAMWTSRFKL